MAQQSLVQDGFDRFNAAVESLDKERHRVQKQLQARRKSLEKQLATSRKNLEQRTRKQVSQLRKTPLAKRAESARTDLVKQVEQGFERLLGALQIASRGDMERVERKLNQINRKLKDLEGRRRTNGGDIAGV